MHPLESNAQMAGWHAEALFRGFVPDDLGDESPEVRLLFEHLSAGCSLCGRQFVNARAASVELLSAQAGEAVPASALRDRIARTLAKRKSAEGRASAPSARILDPSGSIARLHMQGPDEHRRELEVEALHAGEPHSSKQASRILAQLEHLLAFPLLFISLIKKERVVAYAQRGLPGEMSVLGSLERELSFCTHCVNAERPLLVRDAREEPFFRANPSVRKLGVRAYAGVPLRTSNGIAIGTLCALDFKPRDLSEETVAVLGLFAPLCMAIIESGAHADVSAQGAKQEPPLYPKLFFDALLAIEKRRAVREGRTSALIHSQEQTLALVCADHEIAGELSDGRVGILVSGADEHRAAERIASLEEAYARLYPENPKLLADYTMIDKAFEIA